VLCTHLAHDLKVALLAVKHSLLAVGQALEVDLHDALKEGRVDGHCALVDGHSVLGVSAAVKRLQQGQKTSKAVSLCGGIHFRGCASKRYSKFCHSSCCAALHHQLLRVTADLPVEQ
jgi:hypothetical protein